MGRTFGAHRFRAWQSRLLSQPILCGRTHGSGAARILDNLVVLTAGAEDGRPELQHILDLAGAEAQ
jgi:hypothetical protein